MINKRFSRTSALTKYLVPDCRIGVLSVFVDFDSPQFLKSSLNRLSNDLRHLNLRKIVLNISWRRNNLKAENRSAVVSFFSKLDDAGRCVELPFCLPGGPNFEKVKNYVTSNNCMECIFNENASCCGIPPRKFYEFSPIMVKDFKDIKLSDFKTSGDREILSWWAPRYDDIKKIIETAKFLHDGPGLPTILDFGCGSGFLSYLLASSEEVKVTALDPNVSLIERTKFRHPSIEFVMGDEATLAKEWRGRFDAVICCYLPYELDFSPKIKRVLEPKALIYIGDKMEDEFKEHYVTLNIDERENGFYYSLDLDRTCDSSDIYKTIMNWDVISRDDVNSGRVVMPLTAKVSIQTPYGKTSPCFNRSKINYLYPWEKEIGVF